MHLRAQNEGTRIHDDNLYRPQRLPTIAERAVYVGVFEAHSVENTYDCKYIISVGTQPTRYVD